MKEKGSWSPAHHGHHVLEVREEGLASPEPRRRLQALPIMRPAALAAPAPAAEDAVHHARDPAGRVLLQRPAAAAAAAGVPPAVAAACQALERAPLQRQEQLLHGRSPRLLLLLGGGGAVARGGRRGGVQVRQAVAQQAGHGARPLHHQRRRVVCVGPSTSAHAA